MNGKRLTVVIPTRDEPTDEWKESNLTMRTLRAQTFQDFNIVVVWDQKRMGAARARNMGFQSVKTELVLFSDDDIDWAPDALQRMITALDRHPEACYSYGAYTATRESAPGLVMRISDCEFSAERLRRYNFVSTMSVLRSKDFPEFDESLLRFQDWDLWLSLLDEGKFGVFCQTVIFSTHYSATGITASCPNDVAMDAVRRKHK